MLMNLMNMKMTGVKLFVFKLIFYVNKGVVQWQKSQVK